MNKSNLTQSRLRVKLNLTYVHFHFSFTQEIKFIFMEVPIANKWKCTIDLFNPVFISIYLKDHKKSKTKTGRVVFHFIGTGQINYFPLTKLIST